MSRNERIQREVDAITDYCKGEPQGKQIEWMNFCLGNLLSNCWSMVDHDEVEKRVRFRSNLPAR